MKSLTTYIAEKMVYTKATASKYIYFPESTQELRSIISNKIKEEGPDADLNDIDTSQITDMSNLFTPDFCGDVSNWDVSNVTNMSSMFDGCNKFNCNLSNWDISKVENMEFMFRFCREFEGKGLDKWNTDKLQNCFKMFNGCKKFNANLSNWNMEKVTTTEEMFAWCIISLYYYFGFKTASSNCI
jgi:surface protein